MAANILLGGVPEVFHFDSRLYDILIILLGLGEQALDLDFGQLQNMNMCVWLIFNIQGNFPSGESRASLAFQMDHQTRSEKVGAHGRPKL